MEDKNLMEETTEVVSNLNRGKVACLALGAVVALGGIAAAIIYKKKKNKVVESETIVENNENAIEE